MCFLHLPAQQRSKIIYRSYRTFDIDKLNNDIDQIKMENLDSVTSAEQVNETYQKHLMCRNLCHQKLYNFHI
jgi:hypothetical protein